MEKKKDAEDIREWFMRLPVVVHIFLAAIALWLLSLMVLKSLDVYTRHNESIVVPNVKGKTPEEAHREIRKIGLRYIVLDSIYSKDMAPGAIVEVVDSRPSTSSTSAAATAIWRWACSCAVRR